MLRVAFSSSTYLLSQRKQNRLFCLRHWIHVCKYGLSAHVMLFLNCHGGRSGLFAPVVLHWYCPELRPELWQEPAQLRVFRNSLRAMPLFGALHCPISFSSQKVCVSVSAVTSWPDYCYLEKPNNLKFTQPAKVLIHSWLANTAKARLPAFSHNLHLDIYSISLTFSNMC